MYAVSVLSLPSATYEFGPREKTSQARTGTERDGTVATVTDAKEIYQTSVAVKSIKEEGNKIVNG